MRAHPGEIAHTQNEHYRLSMRRFSKEQPMQPLTIMDVGALGVVECARGKIVAVALR